MRRFQALCLTGMVLACALAPAVAHSDWAYNGTFVAPGTFPAVTRDQEGGMIVAWTAGYGGVLAQRFDPDGNELWTPGGVLLSSGTAPMAAAITSDGAGGAIVAWDQYDAGWYDIYAQRVDASGNLLWGPDGVPVCADTLTQQYVKVAPDGNGGAIFVWIDDRSIITYGTPSFPYAQRLDATGAPLWATNGRVIDTAHQSSPKMQVVPDQNGGWLLVWPTDVGLVARRIDGNGDSVWASGTEVVASVPGYIDMDASAIVAGAQGFVVGWHVLQAGTIRARIQGIGWDGAKRWGPDGIALASTPGLQVSPRLMPDDVGGTVVVWSDSRSGTQVVYGQRFDANGAALWAADGVPLCTSPANQTGPQLLRGGPQDFLVVWSDARNGSANLFGQKCSLLGQPMWEAEGVPICTAGGSQTHVKMVSDGIGGAYVVWNDNRSSLAVYALRLTSDGNWFRENPEITSVEDVPNDQGGQVIVNWNASLADAPPYDFITHYSVWRSLSGPGLANLPKESKRVELASVGPDFQGPAYRIDEATNYAWEWLGDVPANYFATYSYAAATLYDSLGTDPGYHHFLVVAHTSEPARFWESNPDSGYSVDNLAPDVPSGLAGNVVSEPGTGLELTWTPNAESDLSHYQVYKAPAADFVPGPGTLVGVTTDTSFVDTGWVPGSADFYKVTALDVHGNEGDAAVFDSGQLTGVTDGRLPRAVYLGRNVPNPFHRGMRIAFGLPEKSSVRMSVHDVRGRLVAMLVDGKVDAGDHSVSWDGKDRSGFNAASGVYFFELVVGDTRIVRKATLLR